MAVGRLFIALPRVGPGYASSRRGGFPGIGRGGVPRNSKWAGSRARSPVMKRPSGRPRMWATTRSVTTAAGSHLPGTIYGYSCRYSGRSRASRISGCSPIGSPLSRLIGRLPSCGGAAPQLLAAQLRREIRSGAGQTFECAYRDAAPPAPARRWPRPSGSWRARCLPGSPDSAWRTPSAGAPPSDLLLPSAPPKDFSRQPRTPLRTPAVSPLTTGPNRTGMFRDAGPSRGGCRSRRTWARTARQDRRTARPGAPGLWVRPAGGWYDFVAAGPPARTDPPFDTSSPRGWGQEYALRGKYHTRDRPGRGALGFWGLVRPCPVYASPF